MDYQTTIAYPGDATEGLTRLVEILSPLGFRIERRERSEIEVTGPGMNNTRQSPLLGISRLRAQVQPGQLTVEAQFGALDRLLWFMGGFLIALGVFLVVLFAILFRNRPDFHLWIVILPFAPWPILLPLLRVFLHRRLRRTLDNVLHNLGMMAK